MNPNDRIPVLVDRARDGFTVRVGSHSPQHDDKVNKFAFDPERQLNDYSETLQCGLYVTPPLFFTKKFSAFSSTEG